MNFEYQYEMTAHLGVKSNKMRLRTCQALPILRWVERKKVHPDDVMDKAKSLYTCLKRRWQKPGDDNIILFECEDMSSLAYIVRLNMWAIKYPTKVDIAYVPNALPEDLDRIGNGAMTEQKLWERIK